MPADLRTRIGHLDLPSPILTASGCAGTGRELAQFTDVARIGAVITKSVTLEPRAGNPAPRAGSLARVPRPPRRGSGPVPADLRTKIGHVDLPSPILTASGCAGAGRELAQFTDVARIGAVITKSVTLEPRAGNPAPRLTETPSGADA